MQTITKRTLRASAVTVGALALAVSVPVAAHAHVGVSGTNTAAGSSTLLTFAFSHGCDGSPTTQLAIQIPDGINAVTPTVNPGWTTEKVTAKLETPVTDAHGNQVTERVAQVVYTALTPVADGLRDTFVLSLTLPEDAAGQTLAFPTVQSCTVGEHAWIELAADGQDPHDLDSPAPTLTVTATEEGAGHHDTDGHDTGGNEDASPAAGGDTGPLTITALVVGALGLATGLLALVRRKTA